MSTKNSASARTPAAIEPSDGAPGVHRRAIIASAAWSVPAVMMVSSSPAFAASPTTVTIAFDKSYYSGVGCTSIPGAVVAARSGGMPAPGISVTVTLSNGYSFADGTTTHTALTGADGNLALGAVNVPAGGGTGTATATSAGVAGVSASLAGISSGGPFYLNNGTVFQVAIPSDSTPVLADLFLTSDGRLINSGSSLFATDVAAVGQAYLSPSGDNYFPLLKKDGTNTYIKTGVEYSTTVPAGSKPILSDLFLTTDGRLLNSGSSEFASNVSEVGRVHASLPSGDYYFPLLKANGTNTYIKNGVEYPAAVPSGSKPAVSTYFLSSDGGLLSASGDVVASNVASVGSVYVVPSTGDFIFPLSKKDGATTFIKNGFECDTVGRAKPAFADLFLTWQGDLVNSGGSLFASNVASVGDVFGTAGGDYYVPLRKRDKSNSYIKNGVEYPTTVPSGSQPILSDLFLTSDGRLINSGSSLFASNVASVGQVYLSPGGDYYFPILKRDGSNSYIKNGIEYSTTVPSGSQPILSDLFLTSDGRLINSGSSLFSSNVESVGRVFVTSGGDYYFPIAKKDGSNTYIKNGVEYSTTVPNGSRPILSDLFLTSGGDLINSGSSLFAANVASVGQVYRTPSGDYYFPVVQNDANTVYIKNGVAGSTAGVVSSSSSVPAGATPQFKDIFLAPDGRLVDSFGSVVASGVASLGQVLVQPSGDYYVPAKARAASC